MAETERLLVGRQVKVNQDAEAASSSDSNDDEEELEPGVVVKIRNDLKQPYYGWKQRRCKAAPGMEGVVSDVEGTKVIVEFMVGNTKHLWAAKKSELIVMDAKVEKKMVPFRQLFRFADRTDKLLMFIGTFGAVINGCSMPAFSFVFAQMIEGLAKSNGEDAAEAVSEWALRMVYIGAGVAFVAFLQVAGWMMTGERQARTIRQHYLRAILRQEVGWFDEHKTGDMVARLTGDTLVIRNALGERMGTFIQQTATFFFSIGYGFWKSWRLTLIILSCLPVIGGAGGWLSFMMQNLATVRQQAYAMAGACAEEVLLNIRTVNAFNAQRKEARRFKEHIAEARRVGIKRAVIQGVGMGIVFLCLFSTFGLGFWYGSYLMEWKDNTVADIVSTFMAVLIGSFAVGAAAPCLSNFAEGRGAAFRIYEVLDRDPEIECNPAGYKGEKLTDVGRLPIAFRGVGFRYPTRDTRLFDSLNLVIQPGTKVALVGHSGCGKSSMIGLLMRFYDVEEGAIMIGGHPEKVVPCEACGVVPDTSKHRYCGLSGKPHLQNGWVGGYDLRDIDLMWWRSQIGIVTQMPCLFSLTIKENILYGNPGATMDQVVEACKTANIHDTIMRIGGYNTKVGAEASKLSGGQKQRIAIARAIVRNPPILLLDEATSALDRASEKLVQEALDAAGKGRTVITIAHRLATIKNYDVIHYISPPDEMHPFAELREGNSGTYKELMQSSKEFSAMVQAQMTAEERKRHEMVRIGSVHSCLSDSEGTSYMMSPELTEGMPSALVQPQESPLNCFIDPTTKIIWVRYQDEVAKILVVSGSTEETVLASIREHFELAKDVEIAIKDDEGGEVFPDFDCLEHKARYTLAVKGEKEEKLKPVPLSAVAAKNRPELCFNLLGTVGSIINGCIYPGYALIFAQILTVLAKAQVDNDLSTVRHDAGIYALMFVGVGVAGFIGAFLAMGSYGYAGEKLTERLRGELFEQILRQDLAFFDESAHEPGALCSMLSGDTEKVHHIFGPSVGQRLQVIFTFAAAMGIAFYTSVKLSLVILSAVPVMIISGFCNMLVMGVGQMNKEDLLGEAGQVSTEAIGNIKTVHAFGLQDTFCERYEMKMQGPTSKEVRKGFFSGFFFGLSQMIVFGAFALSFWYGGVLIKHGDLSFGDVLRCSMAIVFSAMGMGEVSAFGALAQGAQEGATRIWKVLHRVPPIDAYAKVGSENNDPLELRSGEWGEGPQGAIGFRGVSFTYPTRKDLKVLESLDITIRKGWHVGLVGETGCGKSTCMQLILRFYDVQRDSGAVLVDGRDLRTIHVSEWRKHLGLVSQEPILFDMTIRENILYAVTDQEMADPTIDWEERMRQAAKDANVYDEIMNKPGGFDYRVGRKGDMLSGGQKQRVAIARAIVKEPQVLLLDEATSALDPTNEKEVQGALDNIITSRGMTVVSIAHRLTTLTSCDCIFVLENGRVKEEGSHKYLIYQDDPTSSPPLPTWKRHGDYAARWKQFSTA